MRLSSRCILIIALLAWIGSFGQEQNSLLWKISGTGSQPSYLFGTAHLLCNAELDKKTTDAIGKTSQLYLEIDIDDPAATMQMMSLMMMKGGVTISSLLSKEDYDLLDKSLQKHVGASLSMFNSAQPMILSSFFFPSLMDCTPDSVEQLIVDAAKKHNHEVYGLETVAEQFAAMEGIPYGKQLDELIKAVKNDFADERKQLQKLFSLYKAQDLNGLLLLTTEDPTTKDYDDVLLKDRNQKWIPQMINIIEQKPTFFAVGAAHLPGADGVITLLRNSGYTVTAE